MHRPTTSYGIDFSAGHLTVVKCVRARKSTVHSPQLDQDAAALPEGLRGEMDAAAAAGHAIVATGMPVHETVTRWLETPISSAAKARKVLPSLLDIQLPFPLESCLYDFIEFRRGAERGIDALAVAARTQDVVARLGACRGAGFDPARLDHEGLALWSQSIREMPAERNAVRLVVYLGHDRTALVLGQGETFQAAHSIRVGIRDLFPAGADADPNRLRSFAARVQQILHSQTTEPDHGNLQWVWTGLGAARPDALKALQSALSGQGVSRHLAHREPATFLARALGERALEPGPLPCNFRTGALAHPLEARQRAAAAWQGAVVLLARESCSAASTARGVCSSTVAKATPRRPSPRWPRNSRRCRASHAARNSS